MLTLNRVGNLGLNNTSIQIDSIYIVDRSSNLGKEIGKLKYNGKDFKIHESINDSIPNKFDAKLSNKKLFYTDTTDDKYVQPISKDILKI